ncbi:MAG: hypothetical protein IJP48_09765 [Synergistaceae bacterium]|nr:hypothetical protein [Synergistaceae bacterium]
MKKFKAFTLTEILTGTILQAGFVIVLMGAFYMLVNFQAANTKLITAREKGQRVLAYIENRIMHAGLGLRKCSNPSEIRGAFGNNFQAFNNLTLPVAVTYSTEVDLINMNEWKTTHTEKNDGEGIFRGNILTVLYAMPYPGTGNESKILVLDNNNSGTVKTISGDVECKVLGGAYKIGSKSNELKYYAANDSDNLYSYKVTASSGAPLYISEFTNGNNFKLTTKFTGDSIDIASGSELLNLQCEKMFVRGTAGSNSVRIFSFVNLGTEYQWLKKTGYNDSYENGILEVYFELDTHTNILDCYVLASGGRDPSLNTQCPASWPTKAPHKARWLNEYKYYEVYVSRASWKLHNIPNGFSW